MQLDDDVLGTNPNSWARFLGVCLLLPLFYFILLFVLAFFYGVIAFTVSGELSPDELLDGSTPLAIVISFGAVAIIHLVLWPLMRLVYHRKYLSLVNPLRLPWKAQVKWGVIYTFGFLIGAEILALILIPAETSTHLIWQPRLWLLWILPVTLIVFLQITAEEMLIRGFMQQYLARLVPNRWVYIVVPSAFWAILHYWNYDSPLEAWTITASIFALGCVLGDWADRSGSLIGPIAVHFANNFILVCVFGTSLEPSEMNIWQTDASNLTEGQIGVYAAISAVVILAAYIPLRNRVTFRPR